MNHATWRFTCFTECRNASRSCKCKADLLQRSTEVLPILQQPAEARTALKLSGLRIGGRSSRICPPSAPDAAAFAIREIIRRIKNSEDEKTTTKSKFKASSQDECSAEVPALTSKAGFGLGLGSNDAWASSRSCKRLGVR